MNKKDCDGCSVTILCDSWNFDSSLQSLIQKVITETYRNHSNISSTRWVVALILADDNFVRSYNRKYRGKDLPTNVLSFPQIVNKTEGNHYWPFNEPLELGDIMIAYETVCREANEAGISIRQHLIHLIVHGFLHILGYGHDCDDETIEMRRLEVAGLASVGFPDPYKGHL
tara:strand:- start:20992 stop:21504 length:513 start_codon:yes stop_codon:yes gene_type:complete